MLFSGFLTVDIEDEITHIEYAGNMGASIDKVDKELINLGFHTVEEIKSTMHVIREEGDPSYLYVLEYD